MSSTTSTGSKTVKKTTKALSSCLSIESVSRNKIYIRNCGMEDTVVTNDSISVYVDGVKVGHDMNPVTLNPGELGEITVKDLWKFSLGEHTLKVVSGSGIAMAEKPVEFVPNPSAVLVYTFDEGTVKGLEAIDIVNQKKVEFKDWQCRYATGRYGTHFYEYYRIGCADMIDVLPRWKDAKDYCQSRGGYLVIISSAGENNFVKNLGEKTSKWIGYYQDPDTLADNNGWPEGCPGNEPTGCWKWLPNEASTYTNWHSGEPNNARGIENCAHMLSDGTWNDNNCLAWIHFVCEYTSFKTPLNINGKFKYPVLATGKFGNAVYFDGYDDWLQINNMSGLDPQTQVTVFAWVRKTWDFGKWIVNRRSVYRDIPSNPSLHAYWRSWGFYLTKLVAKIK